MFWYITTPNPAIITKNFKLSVLDTRNTVAHKITRPLFEEPCRDKTVTDHFCILAVQMRGMLVAVQRKRHRDNLVVVSSDGKRVAGDRGMDNDRTTALDAAGHATAAFNVD
jgi:hypothetical protein